MRYEEQLKYLFFITYVFNKPYIPLSKQKEKQYLVTPGWSSVQMVYHNIIETQPAARPWIRETIYSCVFKAATFPMF